MFNHILFVCVGNICRSPMAEALLRARLTGEGRYDVCSAGIAALIDQPADPVAIKLLEERDIDLGKHKARQLTTTMIHQADLILAMEQSHISHILSVVPVARGKVHAIGKWTGRDIPDPYRKSEEYFRQVLQLIEEDIDAWLKRII